jgi:Polyketide cyclase / dehydrase and lipid transport
MRVLPAVSLTAGVAAVAGVVFRLVVAGAATVDTGIGRRVRRLGPLDVEIAAPREVVFDVVAAPYLGRTPRAMSDKLEVLERGSDMVVAAHHTPVGRRLVATTVEAVRFNRPETVDFRLLRGPVPHVVERFKLCDDGAVSRLEYTGELGTDGWAVGRWWGEVVARRWEATVRDSLARIRAEAERRAR